MPKGNVYGLNKSNKTYFAMVLILAVLAAVSVFLPTPIPVPSAELPSSKPVLAITNFFIMLIVYGGLGFLGLYLSRKLGFADLWQDSVSNRNRFVLPALIGAGLGIFFIIADLTIKKFHGLGSLPHPPFPTSLVVSVTAGIGEEIMFRLFFISFWTWLVSYLILKNRFQNTVFWIVAVISALAFALGHLPSTMLIFGWKSMAEVPPALIAEIILLNGALSIPAAYCFRKYGFLAPVGIHLWNDVVWHVIWGAFG
jgi:hypothetical protein